MSYDHKNIEKKWQEQWEREGVFHANDASDKEKYYCLIEFPYPSGAGLHIGHPRSYTGIDIIARKKRMEGKNVLYPIGWDAFGLPTENFAIKNNRKPQEVTKENTDTFRRQLKSLGFSFDWSREINTTDPAYYKWTQWMFLQFYKAGLAYKAKAKINWCLSCKIGLANEEVVNGACERCGGEVEKRDKEQWMIAITKYADRLLSDLDTVGYLPKIKKQQQDWIGKSEGAEVDFALKTDLSGYKVVGLHAFRDNSKSAFWPWLTKELESRGAEVKILDLPNSSEPNIDEQVDYILSQHNFDEKTIVITHSLGAVAAMKLLPKIESKIAKLVMVAPPLRAGEFLDGKARPELDACCDWTFDFNAIRAKVDSITVLADEHDHVLPISHPTQIAQELQAQLVITRGTEPHFDGQIETEVLKALVPSIRVFTTRPDTLFGATYMVLAPEHELIGQIVKDEYRSEVEAYVSDAVKKSDIDRGDATKEKTGIFTGAYAINPVNGKEIPIWVADYVMMGYGTGAIMAVPAHDERDFEFAKKFNLPILDVVENSIEPIVGVGVVIEYTDGRVVLQLRDNNTNRYPGMIAPFGGARNAGESLRDCAVRELKEELDLVIDSSKLNWLGDAVSDFDSETLIRIYSFKQNAEIPDIVHEGEKIVTISKKEALEHELVTPFTKNVLRGSLLTVALGGEGMIVNSDFLDGLSTFEAKEKITKWLEEKGLGKATVNFKLRDWVFSRQRYWGEPIPLVHCETCAKHKKTVMAFHGWEGTKNSDFFPYLKTDLESKGYEFIINDAPNTDSPVFEEWFAFAEGQLKDRDTSTMTLVGHSMGTHLVMKLAEKYPFERIILVAPNAPLGDKYFKEVYANQLSNDELHVFAQFYHEKHDIEAIKKNVGSMIVLASADDVWVSPQVIEYYRESFGNKAHILNLDGYGHFSTDAGVSHIPELEQLFVPITGWVPIPDDQLPVLLPEVEKYEPTDDGESPLSAIDEWVNTTCPTCGGEAKRETDTMPNWAGSSWYFLRYLDPKNDEAFADKSKIDYWMPVDLYNGGMEHVTLHLLYSRFWHKFLFDQGLVSTSEPYVRRHSHGLILAEDGHKMSKSKGNVINPDDLVEQFGADTLRMYEMFMGPFEEPVPWSTNGMIGVRRFLDKVARLAEIIKEEESEVVSRSLHKTIKKVTEDIDGLRFNTAVSCMMSFVNDVQASGAITKESFLKFLSVLCPFAPHLSNELAEQLGVESCLETNEWPEFDPSLIVDDIVTIAVQVNGKLRGEVQASPDVTQDQVEALARADENITKHLEGEVKKIIYVSGKLMNFVV